jgi:hypothetical protein
MLYDFKLDPDLQGPTLILVGFDPDPAEKFTHKKKTVLNSVYSLLRLKASPVAWIS